MFIIYKINICL